jgi:hypothetical protein
MQITNNTTGMLAELTVSTDKDGRDHCIVVVKGTFSIGPDGKAILAKNQAPFVYADLHNGDPGTTSIKYECDFAPFKPKTDVIINGHAYSPTGKPIKERMVSLEIGHLKKHIRIIGDRVWTRGVFRLKPSRPVPFLKMPLGFDRAFGGSDLSHPKPKYQGTEMRNPVGVGFHKNTSSKVIKGTPLPNLEDPRDPIRKWFHTPPPAGFGHLGRGWQPRVSFAGTYDDRWLKERFPFLPEDFDPQYFQSAPADQQVPYFGGGEVIRCTGMTPVGTFMFIVPSVEVPVVFRFHNREVPREPNLDTLLIEPDERRILLTWRTSVPVGRKLNALREILVGVQSSPRPSRRSGKLYFKSIDDFVAWKRNKGVVIDE